MNRTPELWAELERDEVTLREACGNTVRNVTASETAGFDVDEPFDMSPYADALFKFFLRNPICQEMGRKFKVSFSASEKDTGLSYIHDLGFIAKIENNGGGLIVYRILKQISTRTFFNNQVFESFRDFIISYAEFEGITIDEHVLNNSLHPMQEDEDEIDEIVDIFALL